MKAIILKIIRQAPMSLTALSLAFASFGSVAKEEQCKLSRAQIEENLRLDFADFDQNPDKGWRPYYKNECYQAAAQLIEQYMAEHTDVAKSRNVLRFHAGQMYALHGQYDTAIALMENAYSTSSSELVDWNAFVDANIAFLEKDYEVLMKMRKRISSQPTVPDAPGMPTWAVGKKMNLDVVDGFIECFQEAYEIAYSEACRPNAESNGGK